MARGLAGNWAAHGKLGGSCSRSSLFSLPGRASASSSPTSLSIQHEFCDTNLSMIYVSTGRKQEG
jgi:hypothetical protein